MPAHVAHAASHAFSGKAACSTFRGTSSDHCRHVDEFDLIGRCFRGRTTRRPGTVLGIGDDAALLDTDGAPLVHARATAAFSGRDDATGMARRVLGGALVRLAARTAAPRWATLGLTLDADDPDWIEAFAAAAAAVCDACAVELIGGDTTRGPGRATVFALGTATALPRGTASATPVGTLESRWPLAPERASEHAIAGLVSVCVDLAARGARIRCDETPGTGDEPRPGVLELVARTDATGIDALNDAAARLHTGRP